MNIVFFVDSYHNKAGTNGVCVKKVADELVNQGHDVYVFSSFTDFNQPKTEFVDGVKVYRIKKDTMSSFNIFVENVKAKKELWKKISIFYFRLRYCFLLWFWPLKSFFAPSKYYRFSKRMLGDIKPDVIVGTYFHLEELLASLKLKKHFKTATHITYTLDAMAGRESPTIFGTRKISSRSIMKWEKYVLEKTDVFCPMKSHIEHFKKMNYPKNLVKKLSFTDIPLFDLKTEKIEKKTDRKIKKIVYTGYSTRESGSAKYLVELMPYLDDVELHLYGVIDDEISLAIDKTGLLNKRIFFYGFVDYDTVSAAQNDADFLATFGSINPCMISGKIFDYFGKKKPIIAFYQIENDSNLYYLKKYPNVIYIKDSNENHKYDAKRLNDFLKKDDFIFIDNKYLLDNFHDNTPESMAELIVSSSRYSNE